VTISDCPGDASFWTWDNSKGVNIDIVLLIIDIGLMMALLVGLETGVVQMYWTELKYKFKAVSDETNLMVP